MRHPICLSFAVCAALLTGTMTYAQEPALQLMPEDELRSSFVFGPDDGLKYAECDGKHAFTCTYIWGAPDEDDALRIEMGGKPDGKKLLLIADRVARPSDFERVLAVYKDAVPVEGLGIKAVWSRTRGQLSMLTSDNMVIHVNTDMTESDDKEAAAVTIANLVLKMQ